MAILNAPQKRLWAIAWLRDYLARNPNAKDPDIFIDGICDALDEGARTRAAPAANDDWLTELERSF